MVSVENLDYALHLPPRSSRSLDQDEEWCEIEIDGRRRRIRFHDYEKIYAIPGLYERLFAERLECDSPRVVAELLGEELEESGVDPAQLAVLDFGAGNGMVGERLADLGAGHVVGIDLLPAARDAAHRDRPGVYAAYYARDLTQLRPGDRRALGQHGFGAMTCVAALGFGDIPPLAFAEAFNLVRSPGYVAFNIRDRFIEAEDPTGFGAFIARMMSEGVLEQRRVKVAGDPLEYLAIVAVKHDDVPLAWAQDPDLD